MKYILYATKKNGDGCVQKIGTYDDIEERQISGHVCENVVIAIERGWRGNTI